MYGALYDFVCIIPSLPEVVRFPSSDIAALPFGSVCDWLNCDWRSFVVEKQVGNIRNGLCWKSYIKFNANHWIFPQFCNFLQRSPREGNALVVFLASGLFYHRPRYVNGTVEIGTTSFLALQNAICGSSGQDDHCCWMLPVVLFKCGAVSQLSSSYCTGLISN